MTKVTFGDTTIDTTPDEPGPLFRIIERGHLALVDKGTAADVRPCEHPSFILDDEMLTVTCAECRQRVEPYAALRRYAAWWERLQRKREHAEHAEWSLLAKSVREMLKRRLFTDEERKTIGHQTHFFGRDSLKDMRELHADVTRRVRDAKRARRGLPALPARRPSDDAGDDE